MSHDANVVQDNVTDAMRRGGYQFAEEIFYKSALQAGFPNASDRAMALYRVWLREGYKSLPDFCKQFVLEVCEGQHSHGCASEAL